MILTKTERVERTLARHSVDRPAVSIWRHFYDREQSAEGLAEAMLTFQQTYDWDFVKVNPRAMYHDQDWGNQYRFFDEEHAKPQRLEYAVKAPADFRKLARLDVSDGVLGEQLAALEQIRQGLGADVPFIMTVFTPLSIAANLAGGVEHFRKIVGDPPALLAGLETITATFEDFVRAVLDIGADGIFLATTQYGTLDTLTVEEFNRFSRPFDQRILAAAGAAWFNMLHVCGANSMVRELTDYPVHALHWDNTHPSNPTLAHVREEYPHLAVVGGVSSDLLSDDGRHDELAAELAEGAQATGNRGWIVGSTCTVPTTSTDAQLRALREAVETL